MVFTRADAYFPRQNNDTNVYTYMPSFSMSLTWRCLTTYRFFVKKLTLDVIFLDIQSRINIHTCASLNS